MATLFISVQCCRCSTMQVKQQKKSGNNWVCSVCNQTQSVRRIHARGHVASDLRSFVQAFNMARADIGSHGTDPVPPRSDGPRALSAAPDAREAVAHGSPFSTAKKRTDWSKYLDPTHEETDDDDAKEGGEQRVVPLESVLVTELPPEKSRRSSIPNCTRRAQLSAAGTDNCFGFKPSLAKRKRLQAALEGKEASDLSIAILEFIEEGGSDSSDPTDAESTEMGGGKVATALQGKTSSSTSSEYLEEGDIQRLSPRGGGQPDFTRKWLLVEEEVHPDFQ